MTVAEFMVSEWWPRYAIPNLASDTRRRYLEVWGHDFEPRIGGYQLSELTPLLVEDLRDQLAASGLRAGAQRKALLLLSGVCKRAVVRGLIPQNPVSMVQMPRTPAACPPAPLAPDTVERIRQIMLCPAPARWRPPGPAAGPSAATRRRWARRSTASATR